MPGKRTEGIQDGQPEVRLEGNPAGFKAEISCRRLKKGLCEVKLRLQAPGPGIPPPLVLAWNQPAADLRAVWSPANLGWRFVPPYWGRGFTARASSQAPVMGLFNREGVNRITFAVSEMVHPVDIHAGIREEDAGIYCKVGLFRVPPKAGAAFEARLRIDLRPVPHYRALDEVRQWWESLPLGRPCAVPEAARLPMYSTWYSFHQKLNPLEVEAQCRAARDLGCGAVIVDDGWQTSDDRRGYAFCGDWEAHPSRFPNLKAHVSRVHALGMKFMLWYAVPFVGKQSRAFKKFKDRILYWDESFQAAVLDPRFPAVRDHLARVFEGAARRWDLDGLKLDFVDAFAGYPETGLAKGGGRDLDSVEQACDLLLEDVAGRLKRFKPDFLIEFRQTYTGPRMRHWANMLRAGDCPCDPMGNRARILDLRMLSGGTAVHSDMLLWSPAEPVQDAAQHLLSALFSVPQISVRLDRLPEEHRRMLKFWMGFWIQQRDLLLDGELIPSRPEANYPLVSARTRSKRVMVFYDDGVGALPEKPENELMIVNATKKSRVILDLGQDGGMRRLQAFDVTGNKVSEKRVRFGRGVVSLFIPPSGLLICEKNPKRGEKQAF